MQTEIWKDINGYEGLYQVSNLGRVKSLDRIVNAKSNSKRIIKGLLMTLEASIYGYYRIIIKGKHFQIHRLVAKAFIPNPDNLPEVNHIDEDKSNNRADNLEWCDRKYNINYGTRNERVAKYFNKTVLCVETGEIFPSVSEAGRFINRAGAISQICLCCNGKRKTAYGYHWQYVYEKEDTN